MPSISGTLTPPHGFDTNDFSTNQRFVTLSGTYLVTDSTAGVAWSYTHTYKDRFNLDKPANTATTGIFTIGTSNSTSTWTLTNVPLVPGANSIKVKGELVGHTSVKFSVVGTITFTNSALLGVQVDPPTGLDHEQYTDKVVINWLGNSTVSYNEKPIIFVRGGSVTEAGIPTVNGYGVVVSGGTHTPNAVFFGPNHIKPVLTDIKFYNAALTAVGAGVNTDKWKIPYGLQPTDGSGVGRPLADLASTGIKLSNVPSTTRILSITTGVLTLNQTLPSTGSIYATFFYNELQNDKFTFTAVVSPSVTGVKIDSRHYGAPVSSASLITGTTNTPSWDQSKLFVDGKLDIKTKPGSPTETVTITFTSPTSYNVSSSITTSGTQGSGTVGRTFYSPRTGLKFTIPEGFTYSSGDTIVFSITREGLFPANGPEILGMPGIATSVLSLSGVIANDTAIVSTVKDLAPVQAGIREQVLLVEKGAVSTDTFQLISADRKQIYKPGVHFTLINSEDVNYPTRIARLVMPDSEPIPYDTELLATFQVAQDVAIKGYNIYASTEAAGGTVGYTKLNKNLITASGVRDIVTSKETRQEVRNGVRATTTLEHIVRLNEYSYEISKSLLADETILGIRPTTDLTTYFVVTAVAATNEPNRKTEVESVQSLEVVAKPIEISNQIQEFVPRTFDEIVEDYITAALTAQPSLDVKPTSVSRDIHIDPVANELEKVYFMLDFVNKSQSFLTLLALDDPENTGTSAADTEYKTKLQLVFNFDDQATTQAFIDSQFDKLASNVSITRRPAEQARGQVTLSTLTRPATALSVSPKTTFIASTENGTVRYNSLITLLIQPELFDSYYNELTRRYEVDVPVIAQTPGSAGNIDAGAITQTSIINFSAFNETPFLYGSDVESNRSLAERALIALMGVDFGTIGGYVKDVVSNPGVLKVTAQSAGDSFMFRDFDNLRNMHIGGKVDLYVQGTRPLVYQEDFGIQFTRIENESHVPVPATQDDSTKPYTITANFPLPGTGSLLYVKKTQNTTSQNFSLEKVIVSGKSITLATGDSINTGLMANINDATFEIGYYTTGNLVHNFAHKPVTALTSLTSTVNGTISTGNYLLSLEDDLFLYGNSAQSRPSISMFSANNTTFDVQSYSESFTLNGTVPVSLSAYSVDLKSLVVGGVVTGTNVTHELNKHYTIVTTGNSTTKTQIARLISSDDHAIPDGGSITVSYNASETFTVQYQVENLVEVIQDSLEKKEYATADVLIKKASEVPVDISAAIILQKGISQSEVDYRIRTALGRHFGSLRLGDSVYQSDIIRILDSVSGVYAVEMPLLKLMRANNSYVLGEKLSIGTITPSSTDDQKSYKLQTTANTNPLLHYTVRGGGIVNGSQRRAVGLYIGSQYYKGIMDPANVQTTQYTCYLGPDQVLVSGLSETLQQRIKSKDALVFANYFAYDNPTADTDDVVDIEINTFEYATLSNLLFSYRERM